MTQGMIWPMSSRCDSSGIARRTLRIIMITITQLRSVNQILVWDGEIKRVYITVLAAQRMAERLTCRLVELRAATVCGIRMLIEFCASVIVQELRSSSSKRILRVNIAPTDCWIGCLVGLVNVCLTCSVGIQRNNLGAEGMRSGIFPRLRGVSLPVHRLRFWSGDVLFQAHGSQSLVLWLFGRSALQSLPFLGLMNTFYEFFHLVVLDFSLPIRWLLWNLLLIPVIGLEHLVVGDFCRLLGQVIVLADLLLVGQ